MIKITDQNETLYTKIIIVASIAIPVVVAILMLVAKPAIGETINLSFLPKFHAILNSIASVCLIFAFLAIKQKNIKRHKMLTLTALLVSVLFLVSYVVYHSLAESTKFGGEGLIRNVYYFILITHIFLAAIILPFVLFTFLRALKGDFDKHKKIARWTLPLWLYVTITGVVVYLMISPYY